MKRRALKRRYGRAAIKGMRKYVVCLNGKWVDTIFFESGYPKKADREANVKRALVNHDDFDSDITVKEAK